MIKRNKIMMFTLICGVISFISCMKEELEPKAIRIELGYEIGKCNRYMVDSAVWVKYYNVYIRKQTDEYVTFCPEKDDWQVDIMTEKDLFELRPKE